MPGGSDAVAKSDISLSALLAGAAAPVFAVVNLATMPKIKAGESVQPSDVNGLRGVVSSFVIKSMF